MVQNNKRVENIRSELIKNKESALLISSVSNITYLTGYSNFSKEEREAYLLITGDSQYIFTDRRYSEAIKNHVLDFELIEISFKNPITKILKRLSQKHDINIVGIEEDDLRVSEHKKIAPLFKKVKHFEIHKVRSIKDREEIKLIEKACQIGDEAFKFLLGRIRPGMTEKELAFELEFFIKKKGADLSFPPIIAFSKNSSIPHHQSRDAVLVEKAGQFILLDLGCKFKNYCSDMTRTIFFGKANKKQKKIYKTVFDAQQKAINFLNDLIKNKKGIKAKEVDKVARDYIINQGFPPIPHSLGHGVGLQVHEPPSLSPKSKNILKQGMVFSIEPGIYIEDYGGVRIEDLFVIGKKGLKQLTKSSNKLIEL